MTHNYDIKQNGRYYFAINRDTGQIDYGSLENIGGVNGKNRKTVVQKAIDMVEKPAIIYLWYISWTELKNEGLSKPSDVTIIQYSREIGEIEHNSDLRHDHHKFDIPDFFGTPFWINIPDKPSDFIPSEHGNEAHNPDFSIVGHEHYRTSIVDFFGSPFWANIPDKPSTYTPSPHTHTESEITDLIHDAQKIKGKEVDDSAIGDNKFLKYNESTGKIEYVSGGTGGMEIHGNEYHDPDFLTEEVDPTIDSSLKGVTKLQVQNHPPQSHSHSESEVTGLITDLASKETPSGSQEKVDAHKDLTTGVHGVGTGTIAKISDIADDTKLSTNAQDAVSKRHSHSNQTLLDSYTQTEVNLADAVSKKHAQVHGSGDHTGIIGTPTQVSLANVTNDAQLKRADGDINSLTLKATPVSADILLIEDSAASFAKKKITIGTLPTGGSGETIDENIRKIGTTQYESWYTPICSTTALTTGALTANRFYAFPFIVPKTMTLDRIAINVTTAGTGNARLGIYTSSVSLGLFPDQKILDAGEISIASTGIKSITISQQLTAGMYFLVIVSNGTPTIRCHALIGIMPLLGYTSSLGAEVAAVGLYVSFTYAALPTTFPTTTTTKITAVPIPAIFVRVSA